MEYIYPWHLHINGLHILGFVLLFVFNTIWKRSVTEDVLKAELLYIVNPTTETQQMWIQKQHIYADISRKKAAHKCFFLQQPIF